MKQTGLASCLEYRGMKAELAAFRVKTDMLPRSTMGRLRTERQKWLLVRLLFTKDVSRIFAGNAVGVRKSGEESKSHQNEDDAEYK